VCAIIFEGGDPRTDIDRAMAAVRRAATLETIEKLRAIPAYEPVVLCTNYPDLAELAAAAGAQVRVNQEAPQDFHFGRSLLRVLADLAPERVLYLGGASAPLMEPADFRRIARALQVNTPRVVVNNPQSADVVGWTPAGAVRLIPLPTSDNQLGYALRQVGLERVLLPNSPWINFDLDTPTDVLMLGRLSRTGPRLRRAVAETGWASERLARAEAVLCRPGAEVALAGRVGPTVVWYLNAHFPVRVRVFSEERGMRAMGLVERRQVTSLLGRYIDRVGPETFVADLCGVADAAFIDTRVLFAHWHKDVSEWDRFHSDLGTPHQIGDPEVRRFTEAVLAAPKPIILGGHCLVSGGVWGMAATLVEQGAVPALGPPGGPEVPPAVMASEPIGLGRDKVLPLRGRNPK